MLGWLLVIVLGFLPPIGVLAALCYQLAENNVKNNVMSRYLSISFLCLVTSLSTLFILGLSISRGQPRLPYYLSSGSIYRFLGQIDTGKTTSQNGETEKRVLVVIEDGDGNILCVDNGELLPENTSHVKATLSANRHYYLFSSGNKTTQPAEKP